jgi:hypothetical protein
MVREGKGRKEGRMEGSKEGREGEKGREGKERRGDLCFCALLLFLPRTVLKNKVRNIVL